MALPTPLLSSPPPPTPTPGLDSFANISPSGELLSGNLFTPILICFPWVLVPVTQCVLVHNDHDDDDDGDEDDDDDDDDDDWEFAERSVYSRHCKPSQDSLDVEVAAK